MSEDACAIKCLTKLQVLFTKLVHNSYLNRLSKEGGQSSLGYTVTNGVPQLLNVHISSQTLTYRKP
jgi:hypothetical protein